MFLKIGAFDKINSKLTFENIENNNEKELLFHTDVVPVNNILKIINMIIFIKTK